MVHLGRLAVLPLGMLDHLSHGLLPVFSDLVFPSSKRQRLLDDCGRKLLHGNRFDLSTCLGLDAEARAVGEL
jgi:hypothetical protein